LTEDKLRSFLETGVDIFMDLTEEGELRGYEQELIDIARQTGKKVTCARFPVPDLSVPTGHQMDDILKTIEDETLGGRAVYVHCMGGIGRTGTVVGCYLAEKRARRQCSSRHFTEVTEGRNIEDLQSRIDRGQSDGRVYR
jgi:protein tyrosine phosphatase